MRTSNPDLKAQRQREIIAAAEACFIKKGFHQTSMQDISAASGLSMGLLYRYFDNKNAIIAAASAVDRDDMLDAVAALPASGGSLTGAWSELIRQIIAAYTVPDTLRLVSEIIAESTRTPSLLAQLQANDQLVIAALSAKIDAQKMSGSLPADVDAYEASCQLMALVDGVTARMLMMPSLSPAGVRNMVTKAVQAILHPAEASPPSFTTASS
jgi:TetR/AcrR family transcriptional regulator, repressor for uid operon